MQEENLDMCVLYCCRAAWEEVCELKAEVDREISEMEQLLSLRMKGIIAGNEISYDNTTDLASMQIITQVSHDAKNV